jgi:hypothetical protein
LEGAGLVVSRKKGQFRLYRANRDHRLFRPLQQLVRNGDSGRRFINRAIKVGRLKRRLKAEPGRREPSSDRPIWERRGIM